MEYDEQYDIEETHYIVDTLQVKALHYKADRRRLYTVIVSGDGDAWLIPSAEVPGEDPFDITLTELATLPKPYDFSKEIEELLPTIQELVHSLWQSGIVTLDDLRRVNEVRNALAILPSANAFVRYVSGE